MVSTPEPVNQQISQEKEKERRTGFVKQVLSGDAVVIRGQPKGGPPPEFTLFFSTVAAPKLARQANPKNPSSTESGDEPYAWEAREFLRKKVIGKEVICVIDHTVQNSGRFYGTLFLSQDGQPTENLVDCMVSEGLVEVKKSGVWQDERYSVLVGLEDVAKAEKRGCWSEDDPNRHKRNIKWVLEDLQAYSQQNKHKAIKAVIEFVRDACTVRAVLLPEYSNVLVMMSGIKAPSFRQDGTSDEYANEAKFFTESRLLHRDVEIIIEGVNNNLLIGTVVHPAGSIAEALLRQGFARCIDWSIALYSQGPENLRAAEREAKEKKLRVWKNYEPSTSNIRDDERNYSAKVVEINNADAITVRNAAGVERKIFLAGIRPPQIAKEEGAPPNPKDKKFRPIYEIPFMFEAREYLRKKLIGQKVDVTLDYIQASRQTDTNEYPERHCCTVKIGDVNVAEALISKGLVTIVYYRQDSEQRPSCYDALLAAETKAKAAKKGLYATKAGAPSVRVTDVTSDLLKAKAFLPSFQRTGRQPGVIEFVGSGSRFRVYLPKDSCVVTVMLAGVSCPKGSRQGPNGKIMDAEPFGNEALQFSKALCLQHDVQAEIDSMDKVGNFIGWIHVDGKNISIELVKAGLASVNYYSAEHSPHLAALQSAEKAAKEKNLKVWSTYVEPTEAESKQEEDVADRCENYKRVMVVETLPGLKFFAQDVDSGPKLESLMGSISDEFTANPPVAGSYMPHKGDICAAKFSVDGQWYRAKVESIQEGKAHILYIDYGNRETVSATKLAVLPLAFKQLPNQATEYSLAFVREPNEDSEADEAFQQLVKDQPVLLNVEYKTGGDHVLVLNAETKDDLGKRLVSDGFALVDARRERRLQKIVTEYVAAQDEAKRKRRNLWRYGDITEDDAKEFGYQQR